MRIFETLHTSIFNLAVLNLDLVKQHVEALDELPRPTLISCRTGPRASAVAYMYAGLTIGADPDDVMAAAEEVEAPFVIRGI